MCKEFGPPSALVMEEIPNPVPGKGEVVVDVAAASVNYPDTLTIRNMYQFKPPLPFSPGGEFAGTVSEIGEGVDSVAVGDRVIAVQIAGGFAEKALVPDPHSLIPIAARCRVPKRRDRLGRVVSGRKQEAALIRPS